MDSASCEPESGCCDMLRNVDLVVKHLTRMLMLLPPEAVQTVLQLASPEEGKAWPDAHDVGAAKDTFAEEMNRRAFAACKGMLEDKEGLDFKQLASSKKRCSLSPRSKAVFDKAGCWLVLSLRARGRPFMRRTTTWMPRP